MQYHSVSPDFAVSPQITVEDIPLIRDAGFKTIICNRPDGEEAGQPSAETIGEAARKAGLSFIETQEAINTLPGPIFAYCRSGNRSAQAWTLATQS